VTVTSMRVSQRVMYVGTASAPPKGAIGTITKMTGLLADVRWDNVLFALSARLKASDLDLPPTDLRVL